MADWRRSLRLFFKFGLLVSLPLTGYLWGQTGPSPMSLAMTGLCVMLAIGAESLASVAEGRLAKLMAVDQAEEQAFNAEVSLRDERLRQMDRIVESLSNQNHDLRGKLVSLHGEVHRYEEEAEERKPQAAPETSEAQETVAEPGEETGGDVTDISSARNRR